MRVLTGSMLLVLLAAHARADSSARAVEPLGLVTVVDQPGTVTMLVTAGVDWAVIPQFRTALLITQSATPDARYTAIGLDQVLLLSRHLALRVDLAGERNPTVGGKDGMVATVGVGLHSSISLAHWFAIEVGSARASRFIAPSLLGTDDLVAFELSGDRGSLGYAVGARFTPLPWLSLWAQTGYRRYLLRRVGLGDGPNAVPLTVDAQVAVAGRVDLGITWWVPGRLTDPECVPPCPTHGWQSVMAAQAFIGARF